MLTTASTENPREDDVLIWVDKETSESIQNQLKTTIDCAIEYFSDDKECVDFLERNASKKCTIVVSGALTVTLVPKISNWKQIVSIYIFDDEPDHYKTWPLQYKKIKIIFRNMNALCEELRLALKHYDQPDASFNIMKKGKLNASFMYTELFKEILIKMNYSEKAHVELAEQSAGEDKKYVEDLKADYKKENALHWYSKEGFLYKKLNQALRELKGDVLVNMGFFVRHVHERIIQRYEKQFQNLESPLTLYRGQSLSQADFDQLKASVGGLHAFNSFLSTSEDKEVVWEFIKNKKEGKVNIYFVLNINPKTASVPFASIKDLSAYEEEKEVLFSMHSVFHVDKVEEMENQTNIYRVEMTLTNAEDEDLKELKKRMRSQLQGGTDLQRLGYLLMKINQDDRAQKIYETILLKPIDESEKAYCYHQLGLIDARKDEYKKAIDHYEQALQIHLSLKTCRENDRAAIYTNLGSAYTKLFNLQKALLCYEEAKKILDKEKEKSTDLATTLGNIGALQLDFGRYDEAETRFKEALEIFKKILPKNHPSIAIAESNIAAAQHKNREYDTALNTFRKVLSIQQQVLPNDHLSLLITQNNIGLTRIKKKIEKKDEDEIKEIDENLKAAAKKMPQARFAKIIVLNNQGLNIARKDPNLAIERYEEAVQMFERSKFDDHPIIASVYQNLGAAHYLQKNYDEAQKYFLQAEKIREKFFENNHPDVKRTKKWLEVTQRKLNAKS